MSDNVDPKLKTIAEKILKKLSIPENDNFGSIIGILMIISITLTLIRVLQECNKNKTQNMNMTDKSSVYGEEIRSYSKKRGWFTRLRIRKIVKRHLPPEDYSKYGLKLVEILMDFGQNITDEDTTTLVEAANV